MSILLKRDTKVYLEKTTSGIPTTIWEIPVLDGFTFTQGNTTTEVTMNEMESSAGVSRRGRRMFNDALDPAEWSFSTYIRPFVSGGAGAYTSTHMHAVEEALWANFVGTGALGGTTAAWDGTQANLTADGTDLNISFAGSDKTELGTFNLYFVMGANLAASANYTASTTLEIYKLTDCTVNEATINFDVEGIAQIDWSGNGETLTTVASYDATGAETEGVTATNNYIRNKLTQMTCTRGTFTGSAGFESSYSFTLTGGSITFSNNIQYLTPETLGQVNTPIGHITGNKAISGNFTCYISPDTAGQSGDFLSDMLANTDVITNEFDLAFDIGGTSAPTLQINLDHCHLEIPAVATDDIIGLDVNFHALPDTITDKDEADLVYKGVAIA